LLSKIHLRRAAEKYRVNFNRFWGHQHHYSLQEWEDVFKIAGFKVSEVTLIGSKRLHILNDFLTLCSPPALMTRKLSGRWIISSRLRKYYIKPFYGLIQWMKKNRGQGEGAIAFFALKK